MLKIILLVSFLLSSIFCQSQNTIMLKYAENIKAIQSDFQKLSKINSDEEKNQINQNIRNSFDIILKDSERFSFEFDSLDFGGAVASQDGLVIIYTWNLSFEDGTFQYFGYLLHKSKKDAIANVFPLESDRTQSIINGENELKKKEWYGAIYYEIVGFKKDKQNCYILIGWDGNNMFTNKKIIESLTFSQNGKPEFGIKVFQVENKKMERLVFEYSKRATMTIMYDEKEKLIFYDHLAPSKPEYQNNFMYYGPDFSYDGFRLASDTWVLQSNIEIRNPNKDIDPKNRKINRYKKE